MEKINYAPVTIEIEGKPFDFEVCGTYSPAEDGQDEEFDINYFYYLPVGEKYSVDRASLLDWPHVKAEVIKQLKAGMS